MGALSVSTDPFLFSGVEASLFGYGFFSSDAFFGPVAFFFGVAAFFGDVASCSRMNLSINSLSSSLTSDHPSKSPGSSIILVVALALLKVSKIQAGWWYNFISPSSLNGLAVTFAIRSSPFSIFCLHFLHPAALLA